MSATAPGARSKIIASAAGSSDSERTVTPVSIFPPCSASAEASASVIDREPPRATAQPYAWQAQISAAPTEELIRPVERRERVGGSAAEQRAALRGLEAARENGRGGRGRQPEADQADRVARNVQHRAEEVLVQRIEVRRRGPEEPLPGGPVGPETRDGFGNRADHHPGAAVVERVGQVDLGPAPLEPVALEVQRAQERRPDGHRVDGRAVVVEHPGNGELARPGTAADLVGGLEHRHPHSFARERERAREPVRARADDDRFAHATGR